MSMAKSKPNMRNDLAKLAKRKLEIAGIHKMSKPEIGIHSIPSNPKHLGLTESLGDLERQIYAFEGSYLKDTLLSGNVILGWNNFHKSAKKIPKRTNKSRLKKKINEADRLFSKSSITSMAAVKGVDEAQVKYETNSETETAYSGSEDNTGNNRGKSNGQETPTSPPITAKRSYTTRKYKLKAKK